MAQTACQIEIHIDTDGFPLRAKINGFEIPNIRNIEISANAGDIITTTFTLINVEISTEIHPKVSPRYGEATMSVGKRKP